MTIGQLILVVVLLLFGAWFTQKYAPEPWRTPFLVVIVIVMLLALVYAVAPGLLAVHIGR
jgi:hypothetical protein